MRGAPYGDISIYILVLDTGAKSRPNWPVDSKELSVDEALFTMMAHCWAQTELVE